MKSDRFLFSCFFAILFCFTVSCQQQPDISINIKRMNDRVVVFECLDANITAIAGSKGLAIVDTHRAPSIMLELKKLFEKEFAGKKILYVINTHGHWDHCSGNRIFPASILVGHENCREYIQRNPANSLQNICSIKSHLNELKEQLKSLDGKSQQASELYSKIAGWEKVFKDLRKGYVITPPSIVFRDSLSLDLGGLILKLIYCGGNAHTDNDIFVCIPEEQILLSGDIFTWHQASV
ncbi:MAG: MBL fold metallo-hydrolase, partial [candidate division Zixibacteria bacterium]|nr:MBL fold metallo-hydrolase [candidate division Zixibacteria bacterium]